VKFSNHFIQLAARGGHPRASSGERKARRLARAVVRETPGLDGEALEGLCEFIHWASRQPMTATDLVNEFDPDNRG